MHLISNQTNSNHLQTINSKFKNADEVWIAVAFLKNSGLQSLLPVLKPLIKEKKKVSIIAGQHFGLTEPKALHTLRKAFASHANCHIHIAHANNKVSVFHPKVFMIRQGKEVTIVIGSANVTHGGLISNIECSILVEASITNKVYLDVKAFFDSMFSIECSEESTLLAIKKYETFYEKQKWINKKSRAIPDRKKAQVNFNYQNLLVHFSHFNSAERKKQYQEKYGQYQQARQVLDQIADSTTLTKQMFSDLLDSLVGSAEEYKLWHSGSLFRLRRKVYPHYKKFQKLVQFIRSNSGKSPSTVFLKSKEIVSEIEGAGINYITEIMMTYNPRDYANLNKNPITVLRSEGDLNIKASSTSFSGDDYEEYCALVKEICQKLGLKDMLEADSFFNDIYWKIYKKK